MKSPLRPLFISLFILAILVLALRTLRPKETNATNLTLYCAAGAKVPVERIAKQYETSTVSRSRLNTVAPAPSSLVSKLHHRVTSTSPQTIPISTWR